MLASTEVDGYLAAKGSFISKKLQKHFDKDKNILDDRHVIVAGLRRWQKGFFNIVPFSGDTFFQLENIESKTNKGSFMQVPLPYAQCILCRKPVVI